MEWTVGQRVTIHSHYNGPRAVRTLVKVSKTRIEDSKGDAWIASSGRSYGCSGQRWYIGDTIEPFEEGDDLAIYKKNLINKLSGFKDWNNLTVEQLEDAYAAIKPTESPPHD